MDTDTLKCKARLRVYRNGTSYGPGTAELMEHIQSTQSLKESCLRMGMSYSKGWKILKRAEDDLGVQLVTSLRGGKDGGKTVLTEDGECILTAYRSLEQEMVQTLQAGLKKYFANYLRKEQWS